MLRCKWNLDLDDRAVNTLDTRLKVVRQPSHDRSRQLPLHFFIPIAQWKRHNDEMVVFFFLSLNLSLKFPTTPDCVNVFLIKNGLDTSY
jgi:hypothetical protein